MITCTQTYEGGFDPSTGTHEPPEWTWDWEDDDQVVTCQCCGEKFHFEDEGEQECPLCHATLDVELDVDESEFKSRLIADPVFFE